MRAAPRPRREDVHLALWGPFFEDDPGVSAEAWPRLRNAAWDVWLTALRAGERGAYPPHGAHHDGIRGEVLRRRYGSPEVYEGGWDARPTIRALAREALHELDAAEPAARAAVPEEYVRLVQEALARPETRIGPRT
jgi:hypothetical protein